MKRRTFILSGIGVAAVAGISIGIPLYKHFHKVHFESGDPLTTPWELGTFCDEKGLREIGKNYRNSFPDESSANKLKALLLDDGKGGSLTFTEDRDCMNYLNTKIHQEFGQDAYVVMDGWVVSKTEARQCALLSLT